MKVVVIASFLIAGCFAAEKPVKPTSIPPAAVETSPGFFRYTDAAGTKWLLHKTPFGVAAVEEKDSDLVKASDAGDRVRFVQASPFGTHTWLKKKSELTEEEQEIWDRQQSRDRAK